jgi:RNA polymerase sigma-70 factor (ECF subfamily)
MGSEAGSRGSDVPPGRSGAPDRRVAGERIAQMYGEMRGLASRLLRRERAGHTLTATAVVHEAVIRLLARGAFDGSAGRSYVFASAARAMREALIDHARRKNAGRRGGGRERVPLELATPRAPETRVDGAAVREALDRLAELSERQARVMSLRYFGGLTTRQVAATLGVSVVTVERDWRLARAWLRGQLGGDGG